MILATWQKALSFSGKLHNHRYRKRFFHFMSWSLFTLDIHQVWGVRDENFLLCCFVKEAKFSLFLNFQLPIFTLLNSLKSSYSNRYYILWWKLNINIPINCATWQLRLKWKLSLWNPSLNCLILGLLNLHLFLRSFFQSLWIFYQHGRGLGTVGCFRFTLLVTERIFPIIFFLIIPIFSSTAPTFGLVVVPFGLVVVPFGLVVVPLIHGRGGGGVESRFTLWLTDIILPSCGSLSLTGAEFTKTRTPKAKINRLAIGLICK